MREKQFITPYEERGGCKPYEGDIEGYGGSWPFVIMPGDGGSFG